MIEIEIYLARWNSIASNIAWFQAYTVWTLHVFSRWSLLSVRLKILELCSNYPFDRIWISADRQRRICIVSSFALCLTQFVGKRNNRTLSSIEHQRWQFFYSAIRSTRFSVNDIHFALSSDFYLHSEWSYLRKFPYFGSRLYEGPKGNFYLGEGNKVAPLCSSYLTIRTPARIQMICDRDTSRRSVDSYVLSQLDRRRIEWFNEISAYRVALWQTNYA